MADACANFDDLALRHSFAPGNGVYQEAPNVGELWEEGHVAPSFLILHLQP